MCKNTALLQLRNSTAIQRASYMVHFLLINTLVGDIVTERSLPCIIHAPFNTLCYSYNQTQNMCLLSHIRTMIYFKSVRRVSFPSCYHYWKNLQEVNIPQALYYTSVWKHSSSRFWLCDKKNMEFLLYNSNDYYIIAAFSISVPAGT